MTTSSTPLAGVWIAPAGTLPAGYVSPPVVPTVVGLDLSLTAAGIADAAGQLHTVGEDGKAGASLDDRRRRLHRQVARVLDVVLAGDDVHDEWPTVVAIEAPAFSRTTGHQHDRSGLWWLVVHQLHTWPGVHVVEVGNSARAKYATGKGNAGKVAVASAASHRYGVVFADDNAADAFVLRAMALDHYGAPLAPVPARNREALASVDWPALDPTEVTA